MTLNVSACKQSDNAFHPHPKFPIPTAIKARIVREAMHKNEEEEQKQNELEAIENLIKSLPDDIDNEEEKESIEDVLKQPVIDETNFDEKSLSTSNIMVNILKLLKSF